MITLGYDPSMLDLLLVDGCKVHISVSQVVQWNLTMGFVHGSGYSRPATCMNSREKKR